MCFCSILLLLLFCCSPHFSPSFQKITRLAAKKLELLNFKHIRYKDSRATCDLSPLKIGYKDLQQWKCPKCGENLTKYLFTDDHP